MVCRALYFLTHFYRIASSEVGGCFQVTSCSGHYGVLFNTNRELLRNYHAERRCVQYLIHILAKIFHCFLCLISAWKKIFFWLQIWYPLLHLWGLPCFAECGYSLSRWVSRTYEKWWHKRNSPWETDSYQVCTGIKWNWTY